MTDEDLARWRRQADESDAAEIASHGFTNVPSRMVLLDNLAHIHEQLATERRVRTQERDTLKEVARQQLRVVGELRDQAKQYGSSRDDWKARAEAAEAELVAERQARAHVEQNLLTQQRELRANLLACQQQREAADAALLASERARAWQPIESAPKDGTLVLVWLSDCDDEDRAFYCLGETRVSAGWSWQQGKLRPAVGLMLPVVTVRPSHWMPIPDPPKDAS